jgi:2-polyprenyl-3-methyl-5-hydroxy-6-metoxy-1,4-benzoquinol methylase
MLNSDLSSELIYQRSRAFQISKILRTEDCVVERYRIHRHWKFFSKELVFKVLGNIREKRVLDFGCGEGQLATQLGRLGARVTGIDISPELIELAQRRAELDRVQDRVEFKVQDILESGLDDEPFDFIVCTDALHHVDLPLVLERLYRSLKPGGKLVAKEPICFSPWFQAVRDRLPIARIASPGDRQLNLNDIACVRNTFPASEITFFNLFGRFSRFFRNANKIDKGHPFTEAAIVALMRLDRFLIEIMPFLYKFYGELVLVGEKPRSQTSLPG